MNPSHFRVLLMCGALLLWGCKRSLGPEVARVGNSVILVEDFQSRLQNIPPEYQQYKATAEGRREFLNLMIREKVLLAEGRKAGLQKEENYRKAIADYKKKMETDIRDYQEGLLVNMTLARLRSTDLSVTDADVRQYYDQHAADFAKPVECQASHILLKSAPEAEQALTRIKNGESFASVARAVSVDTTTAPRGGKLTPFSRGSLMPEFEEAVLGLKEGEISGVVKSSFGYHIIQRNGQRALPAQSYEEAKEIIRTRLQRKKFDEWVAKASTTVGVKIDEQALASFAPAGKSPEQSRGSVQ